MTILVLGATGDTGRLVVQQGLAGGQKVRALVRSPDKLTVSDPGPEVMISQATDAHDIGPRWRASTPRRQGCPCLRFGCACRYAMKIDGPDHTCADEITVG